MLSLVFQAEGRAADIRAKLDELPRLNERAQAEKEQQLRDRKAFSVYFLIGAALITLLSSISLRSGIHSIPYPFVGCLALLLLPAIIYKIHMDSCAIRGAAIRLFDNRKIEMAREFYHVVGSDIPPKARCSVSMDSQGYYVKGRLRRKSSRGLMLFGNIRRMLYVDPWFSATGKLHDGNAFSIAIEHRIKVIEKRRTKLRFMKHSKTRFRMRSFHWEKVRVTLRIDPSTYPGAAHISGCLLPGAKAGALTVENVSLKDSLLTITARTPIERDEKHLVTGRDLVSFFILVYHQLRPCRQPMGA